MHVHISGLVPPGHSEWSDGQVTFPTQLAPSCTLLGGGHVSAGQSKLSGGHDTTPFAQSHVYGIVDPVLHGSIWNVHDPPQLQLEPPCGVCITFVGHPGGLPLPDPPVSMAFPPQCIPASSQGRTRPRVARPLRGREIGRREVGTRGT